VWLPLSKYCRGEQVSPRQVLLEKPFGLFKQYFAVCCAHNFFAGGEEIPHLQPEKNFLPGTRPDRK